MCVVRGKGCCWRISPSHHRCRGSEQEIPWRQSYCHCLLLLPQGDFSLRRHPPPWALALGHWYWFGPLRCAEGSRPAVLPGALLCVRDNRDGHCEPRLDALDSPECLLRCGQDIVGCCGSLQGGVDSLPVCPLAPSEEGIPRRREPLRWGEQDSHWHPRGEWGTLWVLPCHCQQGHWWCVFDLDAGPKRRYGGNPWQDCWRRPHYQGTKSRAKKWCKWLVAKNNVSREKKMKHREQFWIPYGGVGRWVDVDLNLGATGTVADPLANFSSSPVRVWQVVKPSQRIGQQANIGTAETEAPALWSPFRGHHSSWSGLALLNLVFVRSAEGKKPKTTCQPLEYPHSIALSNTTVSITLK